MKIPQEIANIKWVKRWAGSYTFISCFYWGRQYYFELKKEFGIQFDHTLFIHKKGVVTFLMPESEFRAFGTAMVQKLQKDEAGTLKLLNTLKENSDKLTAIMKRLGNKIPTWDEYTEFLKCFSFHLPLHSFMKKTVDFLPDNLLQLFLPQFKDARVYSEHVYSDTEKFFRGVMSVIAQKEAVSSDALTCMTQQDFEAYLKKGILPDLDILQNKFDQSVLYFKKGEPTIFTGSDIEQIETVTATTKITNSGCIEGAVAFKGVVKGIVRIILDPNKISLFNQGDILVTGMTRPEFLPFVKKAGAIITDVGGTLCHAAIVARELKKPCIIGTAIATTVLKDGDMVEVNADKGVITIIK